jgi:hypothetical protein
LALLQSPRKKIDCFFRVVKVCIISAVIDMSSQIVCAYCEITQKKDSEQSWSSFTWVCCEECGDQICSMCHGKHFIDILKGEIDNICSCDKEMPTCDEEEEECSP